MYSTIVKYNAIVHSNVKTCILEYYRRFIGYTVIHNNFTTLKSLKTMVMSHLSISVPHLNTRVAAASDANGDSTNEPGKYCYNLRLREHQSQDGIRSRVASCCLMLLKSASHPLFTNKFCRLFELLEPAFVAVSSSFPKPPRRMCSEGNRMKHQQLL